MQTSRKQLTVGIDWITGVFKQVTSQEVMLNILGIPIREFITSNKKIPFKDYNLCLESGYIQIYINRESNKDKSTAECYLNISGTGCTQLYQILQAQGLDWHDFFQICYTVCPDFYLTRLDIAIDDRNPIPFFTIEQLHKKCKNGHYLSMSRHFQYKEKTFLENDRQKILYIGATKSNKLIRFYDKDKEQAEKQRKPLEEIGSWKRTEIQLRTETATQFVRFLIQEQNLDVLTFDYLSHLIQFVIENPNEPDKTKWKTCSFWERFLGSANPLKIKVNRKTTSLAETEKWLLTGGAISALRLFEILEEQNALGELRSLQEMKDKIPMSKDLCNKAVAHLKLIGRTDCIPLVYNQTKKDRGTA